MFIFFNYLYWHYSIAPQGILGLLRNYSIGVWHEFLISRHFKTLFSAWHRAQPSDIGGKKGIGDKIMDVVINFYIRILAAIVRLSIIISGLIYEAILYIVFLILYALWLIWPLIVVASIFIGFRNL